MKEKEKKTSVCCHAPFVYKYDHGGYVLRCSKCDSGFAGRPNETMELVSVYDLKKEELDNGQS